jgi:hypothetical protein
VSVGGAAMSCGVSGAKVYRWRKRPARFADRWSDALQGGADMPEDEARRRAVQRRQTEPHQGRPARRRLRRRYRSSGRLHGTNLAGMQGGRRFIGSDAVTPPILSLLRGHGVSRLSHVVHPVQALRAFFMKASALRAAPLRTACLTLQPPALRRTPA